MRPSSSRSTLSRRRSQAIASRSRTFAAGRRRSRSSAPTAASGGTSAPARTNPCPAPVARAARRTPPRATGLSIAGAAGLTLGTRAQADDPSLQYGRSIDWDPSIGFDAWNATRKGWEQWRAAEGLDWAPDAVDLAETPNKVLTANYVTEGIARLRRFEADPRFDEDRPILYDVDRLSND